MNTTDASIFEHFPNRAPPAFAAALWDNGADADGVEQASQGPNQGITYLQVRIFVEKTGPAAVSFQGLRAGLPIMVAVVARVGAQESNGRDV